MYISWQCIYYLWYNKTGASAKAGSLSFLSCVVTWSGSVFKAASGFPLDICFLYITWGLGRVRTNVTPLDRRQPRDHLGTWSSLNQSRLLVGLGPQNHLGAWSNPNHCHASWSGIYATNHLGTWLTWIIVTPIGGLVLSDHGNTIWSAQYSIFLQTVFIIAFASMFFSWLVCSLFLLDFFYVNKHLFSGSADGFDSPLIRRSMPGLFWPSTVYKGAVFSPLVDGNGL